MGRYVRKFAENEKVVDMKIRTRAMAKRMKISVASTTSSCNVYNLRSRRCQRRSSFASCRRTETTSSEDTINQTSPSTGSEVIVISSEFPPVSCSSSNITAGTANSSEIAGNHQVESNSEASSKFVGCSLTSRSVEMKKIEEAEIDSLNHSERKSRVQINRLMMPLQSEIDEFFSSAEKDLQKRFSDKYNFDVVKDVPLEGRYEWVQITP
ncbi:cyclin-dependent kinase inhibitor 6-like [Silene latifolia]|uniref:cyclin-dependent kinase inhibitor 6-like n=1 Tax=Silene latifolia TaxID=37657 RepID=UPI003D77A4A7